VIERYDGYVAQLLGMVSSSILAIQWHTKMMPKDQSERAWVSSLPWETQYPSAREKRYPTWLSVWASILDWWLSCMGGAGRQEQLALGEVPNMACASKDCCAQTVVISEVTLVWCRVFCL